METEGTAVGGHERPHSVAATHQTTVEDDIRDDAQIEEGEDVIDKVGSHLLADTRVAGGAAIRETVHVISPVGVERSKEEGSEEAQSNCTRQRREQPPLLLD